MEKRYINGKIWLVVLAVLTVAIVATIVVTPIVVESKLRSTLGRYEEKYGVKVAFDDLRITTIRTLCLDDLALSGDGRKFSEQDAVKAKSVCLSFSHLPFYSRDTLKVLYVSAEDGEIFLSDTSFIDRWLKTLKSGSEKSADGGEKKQSLFSPLPEISANRFRLSFGEKKFFGVSDAVFENFDYVREGGGASASAKVIVNEKYRLSAKYFDGKTRYATIEPERETIREILNADRDVSFKTLRFDFPADIRLGDVRLSKKNSRDTLFSAKEIALRLMSFPPEKDGGVYIKQFEAYSPRLHISVSKQGDDIEDLRQSFKALKQSLADLRFDDNRDLDDNPGEEGPTIAKKQSLYEKLFFSQRFYFENVVLIYDDDGDELSVKLSEAEVGYRGIRKIVSYALTGSFASGASGKFALSGRCKKNGSDCSAEASLEALSLGEWSERLTDKLSDAVESEEHAVNIAKFFADSLILNNLRAGGKFSAKFDLGKRDFEVAGSLSMRDFSIKNDALSPEKIDIHFDAEFVCAKDENNYRLQFDSLKVGDAQWAVSWQFQRDLPLDVGKGLKGREEYQTGSFFRLGIDALSQNAQSLFESIPFGIRSDVSGLRFSGNAAFHLHASGWLHDLKNMTLNVDIAPGSDFSVAKFPKAKDIFALNTGMALIVNDPNATKEHSILIPPSAYASSPSATFGRAYEAMLDDREVGMSYPDWITFERLNPWLIQLITTTEDGSFFKHRGFSTMQIKAAFEKNFNKGTFYRGASTISMQLIKNLFFDRNKNLARKFQEALYTYLMESVVRIPKERIMELYFNVIEFGPEIYGIEQAAMYYFGKSAYDLSLKESAFLVSIIPSPRRGAATRAAGKLSNSQEKTLAFYIDEMMRRKCSPKVLERLRENNTAVFSRPCCPSESTVARYKSETLSFFMPGGIENPTLYDYNPARPEYGDPVSRYENASKRRAQCGNLAEEENILDALFPENTGEEPVSDDISVADFKDND